METIVSVAQIVVSVALIIVILMQESSGGIGGAFGGGGGGDSHHTRRGMEKLLFWATITLAALFGILAIVNLLF